MTKLGKQMQTHTFNCFVAIFERGYKIATNLLLQLCTVSRPGKTKLRMPVPLNRLGRWVAKLGRWVA
jgi:hypothetical protein